MLSGANRLNDTTYLYHPDNKDFYLETLKELEVKDCVQSRNIINYLDLSEKELSGIKFGKHINNCTICQEKFLEGKALFTKITENIPQMGVSYEAQTQFNEDLSVLIKNIKIKELDKVRFKMKMILGHGQAVVRDIFSSLFSVLPTII